MYETTARTALQVWLRRSLERVVDGPTARTHATVPACHLGCLGMGGVAQFVPSAGREGVGGRVAGERDPEARGSVRPGPRGFPPRLKPRLLAPAWGGCAVRTTSMDLSGAACCPPLHRAMAVIASSPLSSLGSSLPLARVYDPSVWVCTTTPSNPPLPYHPLSAPLLHGCGSRLLF